MGRWEPDPERTMLAIAAHEIEEATVSAWLRERGRRIICRIGVLTISSASTAPLGPGERGTANGSCEFVRPVSDVLDS
jgi:hypothetical protein